MCRVSGTGKHHSHITTVPLTRHSFLLLSGREPAVLRSG
jgi:hypothetical protein